MYLCIVKVCCEKMRGFYVDEKGYVVGYVCEKMVEEVCERWCKYVANVPREAWWSIIGERTYREIILPRLMCRHVVFKKNGVYEVWVFPPCSEYILKAFNKVRLIW